ncbi:MAG: hypothetical protein P1U83_06080 [Roseovarius sp.]|nr:hypothetical protein [Roseovarius sp.]
MNSKIIPGIATCAFFFNVACTYERETTGSFKIDGNVFHYEYYSTEYTSPLSSRDRDNVYYIVSFPDGTKKTVYVEDDSYFSQNKHKQAARGWLNANRGPQPQTATPAKPDVATEETSTERGGT